MREKLITVIGVIILTGFSFAAFTNIRNTNNKIKFKEIEVKSQEVKLKQLNQEYDKVLETKTKTEEEKKQQSDKIHQLEQEKLKLEEQLSAKLKKQEEARLAKARLDKEAKQVAGVSTASALSSGCDSLRTQLLSLGVGLHEIDSAIKLAQRESSCNHQARNRTSNACGVFQSLPCGKWGQPGTTQYLQGAIKYARDRYGDYNKALAHSYANNWY